MKKLSIYLLIIMGLFITGCSNNKVLEVATLDDFNTVLVNDGFTVTDNSKYDSVSYIEGAKTAILDDIQIDMIDYTDSESATKVQNEQIDEFNLLKSTGAHEIKEKGSNYYKYGLISNGRYMISVRVDDTLVFCKALLEDKETVENIISKLGY